MPYANDAAAFERGCRQQRFRARWRASDRLRIVAESPHLLCNRIGR